FLKLLAVSDPLIKASAAKPAEPYLAGYIRDLNERGIETMVLTSRGVSLEKATVDSLASNGFRFSYRGRVRFPGPREEVVCQDGVCLTAGQDKGQALLGFLKATRSDPDVVLSVDNDPKYPRGHHAKMIDAVKIAAARFDLHTFRYTRYNDTLREYAESDRSIA